MNDVLFPQVTESPYVRFSLHGDASLPCDGLRWLRRRQHLHGLRCSPNRIPITPQNSLTPHKRTTAMNTRNEIACEKGNHHQIQRLCYPPQVKSPSRRF